MLAPIAAFAALLACSHVAGARTLLEDPPVVVPDVAGVNVAGYTFKNNYGVYTGFSKDACDIAAALSKSPPDFDTALTVFSAGKNSPRRSGGFRSLGGFANRTFYPTPGPFRSSYISYFNNELFMDAAMKDALALAPTTLSAEMAKLIPQNIILLNFVMHELDSSVSKTEAQGANYTSPTNGAPANLEEVWGLYAGFNNDCAIYSLAQRLAKSFGTTIDVNNGKTCYSNAHNRVLAAFNKMYSAALKGDLAKFKQAREEFIQAILVPFIQGTLYSAAQVNDAAKAGKDPAVALARGRAFFMTIEPLVAAADQGVVTAVKAAFAKGVAASATTYETVKAALESVYPKLKVNAAAVGKLGAKTFLKCNGTLKTLNACKAKCPKPTGTYLCGTDGNTYSNKCLAACHGAKWAKNGKC